MAIYGSKLHNGHNFRGDYIAYQQADLFGISGNPRGGIFSAKGSPFSQSKRQRLTVIYVTLPLSRRRNIVTSSLQERQRGT